MTFLFGFYNKFSFKNGFQIQNRSEEVGVYVFRLDFKENQFFGLEIEIILFKYTKY